MYVAYVMVMSVVSTEMNREACIKCEEFHDRLRNL